MNKQISIERLYSLGDYRNIKFVSTITDIPEHIALNGEAVKLLWYMQLVEIEEARARYDLITASVLNTDRDSVALMLEEERMQTYTEFLEAITKKEN